MTFSDFCVFSVFIFLYRLRFDNCFIEDFDDDDDDDDA